MPRHPGNIFCGNTNTMLNKPRGNHALGLISGVSPESLIELRRNGAMSELREIIGKGIHNLDSASSATFSDVRDAVISNMDQAFAAHDRELRELASSHRRFFGVD